MVWESYANLRGLQIEMATNAWKAHTKRFLMERDFLEYMEASEETLGLAIRKSRNC
jgi:hypothetical protein